MNDVASTFITAFDRNAGKSEQAFVQDFQATIAARFPGFYGLERFKGQRTEAHYPGHGTVGALRSGDIFGDILRCRHLYNAGSTIHGPAS